ncbi:MAG: transcription termination factor NusA [Lachnospiraceae bacterium]|nr:transcription termination factor NusA [Lachnospiraceae bacterium]
MAGKKKDAVVDSGKQLLEALDLIEKEKGISRELMFQTIEDALKEEYKAEYEKKQGDSRRQTVNTGAKKATNVEVDIDHETGKIHIYSERTVVSDEDHRTSPEKWLNIGITKARQLDPSAQIGSMMRLEMRADEFKRTAAKKAKSTIIQKIREKEKEAIVNEFAPMVGHIVTGKVERVTDHGDILINLRSDTITPGRRAGQDESEEYRTPTMLREKDQIRGEVYHPGEHIRVYIQKVEDGGKAGVTIEVSRTAKELVKELFEEEVSEIHDGIVQIRSIAREAGSRTKIAVSSNDPNVDPIGACVGPGGTRVRTIVNELGGEQIDVVAWDENPAIFIGNALSPASVSQIFGEIGDEDEVPEEQEGRRRQNNSANKAIVIVPDDQLSLAIGKTGQNVRLAAQLTNYHIDIKSESEFYEANPDAAEDFEGEEGYGDAQEDDRIYLDDGDLPDDDRLREETPEEGKNGDAPEDEASAEEPDDSDGQKE